MANPTSDAILLRLKWRLAFDRWERKLGRWVETVKAGFDPHQPRVPAGNSDGGRWTRTGGAGKPAASAQPKKPRQQSPRQRPKARRPSPVKKLTVPTPKVPAKTPGPLPPAPNLPPHAPPIRRVENRVAKEVGKWLLKAAARRALGPIGLVLDAIDVALWLHKHYPDIQSYFDEPRSLKALQDAADDPLVGYEIHHIRRINLATLTIDELLQRYVQIGLEQDEALLDLDTRRFNRLFDRMIEVEMELSSRGRQARLQLLTLYEHPNAQVRLNAFKETLAVAPKRATEALEELADSVEYPQAGDAGMCLWALEKGIFKPT